MKKIILVIMLIIVCMYADDLTYELYTGWNNISVPCDLYGEELSEIFPHIGTLYQYNPESGAYEILTTVPEPHKAFWLMAGHDTTISIECVCFSTDSSIDTSSDPYFKDKEIYICDWYGHRLVRIGDMYGTNWINYGIHGNYEGEFDGPIDCKVGPDGRIYVVDRGNNRVVRMNDMYGSGWTTTPSTIGLYYPRSICFDDSGRIYITDPNNNRIVRLNDISGEGMVSWGYGVLNQPNCVKIDRLGRILITDTNNHRIVRIDDMAGTGFVTYGSYGSGAGQFNSPRNIDIDSHDRIYLTDRDNHRIVRIDDITGENWITYGTSGYSGAIGTFGEPDGISIGCGDAIYIGGDDWIIRINDMLGSGWISYGSEGSGIGMFNHTVGVFVNN